MLEKIGEPDRMPTEGGRSPERGKLKCGNIPDAQLWARVVLNGVEVEWVAFEPRLKIRGG